MTDEFAALRADLAAEHADLDALVAPLPEAGWSVETPADGWTVRDSILHLALTDEVAALAADDPFRVRGISGRAAGRGGWFSAQSVHASGGVARVVAQQSAAIAGGAAPH